MSTQSTNETTVHTVHIQSSTSNHMSTSHVTTTANQMTSGDDVSIGADKLLEETLQFLEKNNSSFINSSMISNPEDNKNVGVREQQSDYWMRHSSGDFSQSEFRTEEGEFIENPRTSNESEEEGVVIVEEQRSFSTFGKVAQSTHIEQSTSVKSTHRTTTTVLTDNQHDSLAIEAKTEAETEARTEARTEFKTEVTKIDDVGSFPTPSYFRVVSAPAEATRRYRSSGDTTTTVDVHHDYISSGITIDTTEGSNEVFLSGSEQPAESSDESFSSHEGLKVEGSDEEKANKDGNDSDLDVALGSAVASIAVLDDRANIELEPHANNLPTEAITSDEQPGNTEAVIIAEQIPNEDSNKYTGLLRQHRSGTAPNPGASSTVRPSYHHSLSGEGLGNLEHVQISVLADLLAQRKVTPQETGRIKSPNKFYNSLDSSMMDDEHRLIARYAARLAANANNASRSPTELGFTLDSSHAQRDLISQLEAKNREIMKEIQHLRYEQEQQNLLHLNTPTSTRNPTLLAELRLLRQRRDELETRMTSLQDSRKDLMVQLEGLMKLLKSHSPRSSPNTSPRAHEPALAHTPHSAPPSTYNSYNPYPQRAASAPPTPGDTLSSLSGDVSQAFGHPSSSSMITGAPSAASSVRSLRQDLLVAADSVTNAMSSLVKELNSEASSSEDESMRSTDNGLDISSRLDELAQWREDMKQHAIQENDFMAQLQARRTTPKTNGMDNHYIQNYPDPYRSQISGDEGDPFAREENTNRLKNENNTRSEMYDRDPKQLQIFPNKYLTDEDSCLETDQESYIRTDDEEGGNTEWEESMRRWVNR